MKKLQILCIFDIHLCLDCATQGLFATPLCLPQAKEESEAEIASWNDRQGEKTSGRDGGMGYNSQGMPMNVELANPFIETACLEDEKWR